MTRANALYLILNTLGAGLLALAAWEGWLARVYEGDASRISVLIFALFLWADGAILLRRFEHARWIGNQLVLLGLIGTVLGFIQALSGIDAGRAGDVAAAAQMVSALVGGMGTALYTTLVGSVLYLCIETLLRVVRERPVVQAA